MSMNDFVQDKKKEAVKWLVAIAIYLIVSHLPTGGDLTPLGLKVLGIFLAVIFGWLSIGILWPSIFGMLGFILIDATTLNEFLAPGWGSNVALFLIVALLFAKVVEESSLGAWLTDFCLSRKLIAGRPYVYTFFLFFISWNLAWMSNCYLAVFMFIILIKEACRKYNMQPGNAWSLCTFVGCAVAAVWGQMIFSFYPQPVVFVNLYQSVSGNIIDPLRYTIFMVVSGLLGIIAYTLFMKFVLRPDVSALRAIERLDKSPKMTREQKIVVGFLVLLVVGLLLPSILPENFVFCRIMAKINTFGYGVALVFLLSFIPKDHGKGRIIGLGDFDYLASKSTLWPVLFVCTFIVGFSPVMNSEETGIITTMSGFISDHISMVSPFIFAAIAISVAILVTNTSNNMVIASILLMVLPAVCASLDMNSVPIGMLVILGSNTAFATPAAYAALSAMFTEKEYITGKYYLYSFIAMIFFIVFEIFVAYPIAQVLFT